jgi:hypothetical protein
MADIQDESGAVFQDESGTTIQDEAGGGVETLTVSDAFHQAVVLPPSLFLDRSLSVGSGYLNQIAEIPNVTDAGAQSLVIQSAIHRSVTVPPIPFFSGYSLTVQPPIHAQLASRPNVATVGAYNIVVQDPFHTFRTDYPVLSGGGGTHDNTEHITYSGQDYLKCRHLAGNLTGTYTSPVFDIGDAESQNRHLIYLTGQDDAETDIVITGTGTTWADKFPTPTTWAQGSVDTKTWAQIFELNDAPSVSMRMYYGTTDPPTNYVDRMEILSAIIPGSAATKNRYFRIRITITDPNINVYAYVEAFNLKLCTYS